MIASNFGGGLGPLFGASVTVPITTGQTVAFAGGPTALSYDWVTAARPVVQIEKGWASGTFVDLYAHSDGGLYTQARGGTLVDSTYAGANKLLVHRIYNQGGSNPATDYISAISDDKRVILDVTVPTNPAFAGYSTGSQDANQHATIRGYTLPATVTLKTNDHPLTIVAIHEWTGAHDENLVQDDVLGTTATIFNRGNYRSYLSWAVNVSNTPSSAAGADSVPVVWTHWAKNDVTGIATNWTNDAMVNGVHHAAGVVPSSATTKTLTLFGPTNSLRGRNYGVLLFQTTQALADMVSGGITKRAARLVSGRIQTDKPSIGYPILNCVIPMSLTTQKADIPVRLIGKPSKAYEASWNGGAYTSVGTTDANGYLAGALAAQDKGNGTFNIREVGGTTPIAIANVAVGIVIAATGESGAAGRGDDVTVTIPAGSLRFTNTRANWTATTKQWWKLVAQKYYDTYGCVIGVCTVATGSTFFYKNSPVQEGNWAVTPNAANAEQSGTAAAAMLASQFDLFSPNIWIWDIGLNDASLATTKSQFKTRFEALLANYRTRSGNSSLVFAPIISGPNSTVDGDWTAEIRNAEAELWDEANGFIPAGCFAHLAVGADGVHLWTTADKEAARDVLWRTVYGEGRGPKFSSASASGTSVIVNLTGGISPMTISGGANVAGWTVSDGGGALTVSNVAVSTMQVTLTVNRTVSGTVSIKWAHASTAIGTTLKDSGTVTPLPPEPFQTTVVAT